MIRIVLVCFILSFVFMGLILGCAIVELSLSILVEFELR